MNDNPDTIKSVDIDFRKFYPEMSNLPPPLYQHQTAVILTSKHLGYTLDDVAKTMEIMKQKQDELESLGIKNIPNIKIRRMCELDKNKVCNGCMDC